MKALLTRRAALDNIRSNRRLIDWQIFSQESL